MDQDGNNRGYIAMLAVDKNYRKRGIGQIHEIYTNVSMSYAEGRGDSPCPCRYRNIFVACIFLMPCFTLCVEFRKLLGKASPHKDEGCGCRLGQFFFFLIGVLGEHVFALLCTHLHMICIYLSLATWRSVNNNINNNINNINNNNNLICWFCVLDPNIIVYYILAIGLLRG